MPLDTIYLTRHGHRLNWTIDLNTGTYKSQFPTPTGNPADPALTSHGVRQSHELAAHIGSPDFHPKPFRVYSSPFYRCLQTIQPSVEELKKQHERTASTSNTAIPRDHKGRIEQAADLDVRIENGLGEWFGPTTFFDHPSHPTPSTMQAHFPTLIPLAPETKYIPLLHPSTRGETIAQLHNRVATALEGIIADVDAEVTALEADIPAMQRTSKSILICAHAAPLIAMGRALTGRMPVDSSEEDFNVFTAGLSTFKRRVIVSGRDQNGPKELLAEGTQFVRAEGVPAWEGRGVGGGWECVANGDCTFLSGGAERGWHFNGEESFDTGPMAASLVPSSTEPSRPVTKL
ncbi:Histidine phosphatase superfamily clade-1 [Penicillium macrosclerotiorum]|uniref:Histidine phosphatase superfamily clade-1 n=1 Tax=Penicillium macrosclerotiorum TaxID=303699 RepID=UPI0025495177|nr:Histidine phosphatase superfamily clade-1 [Penicillium macrosclerotiorum]KAJ5682795.1 Histidine phosphatase superfamily clade-1 [Penicillium macrosclerotiorum]